MTPPRRVLIVSPQFPSPALPLNGIAESRLLKHLPGLGFRPRVVVPLPRWYSPLHGSVRGAPAVERSGGAVVAHPRYLGMPSRMTSRGYGLELETRSYRRAVRPELQAFHAAPDAGVIHAHSCVMAGYALLPLRANAPLAVTVHDSDLQTTARLPRLQRRIAVVLSGASHVVYQSEKLRALGEELVGEHPSSVIPWGVHTYGDLVRQEPDVFTVTAVARLVPTKGLRFLLRAFHRLLAEVPDARLEIIGDGPERRVLERLIRRLGLDSRVRLCGWLHNRHAQERVAASSAFVLPSYMEALGVAYLEAMSVGVPTVGVRGQGIGDVIEHGRNGLLLPPRDVDAVLEAMRVLATDRALSRRLGEEGRRTFLGGPYGWERNAEAHAGLYRQLLESAQQG